MREFLSKVIEFLEDTLSAYRQHSVGVYTIRKKRLHLTILILWVVLALLIHHV